MNVVKVIRAAKIKIYSSVSSVNVSPIIVLGNQKSGTSVITHLIAEYGGLTKTVDIPESWWPTLGDLILGNIRLKDFARKHSFYFSKDVIKEPNLTFLYDQLTNIHPKAEYVFVIRDPRSNIRSLLNRVSIPGNLSKIDDIYSIPNKWRPIFDHDLWGLPSGNYVETLAWRWVKAAKIYLDNKESFHLIRYEDFILNKLQTIEVLAQNLKIQKNNDITDLLNKQFQPRGDKDIGWEDFFGKKNLKRIENICEKFMADLNYS